MILAIETSCDETSSSVIENGKVKSLVTYTQDVHSEYGGIVPELASCSHLEKISLVVQQSLKRADISIRDVSAVAVTQGPGLIGSLLVGVCYAKGLSIRYNIPFYGVDHIEAHAHSGHIEYAPPMPYVCLVISGGHTELMIVNNWEEYLSIGRTLDDAIGEAIDKIGSMLGIPYPAGKIIDELAFDGDPYFWDLPVPMLKKGLDFSFSGLKTAVRYRLNDISEKKDIFIKTHKADICASLMRCLSYLLVTKIERALGKQKVCSLVMGGGVASSRFLRKEIQKTAKRWKIPIYIPSPRYCTDNAAMIGMVVYYRLKYGVYSLLHGCENIDAYVNFRQKHRISDVSD